MERMDTCAFVLAADEGVLGGLAVTWLTRSAHHPETWTISLGKNTHTLALIRASREFVLAFATPALQQAFMHFGTVSGHDSADKFTASGLRTAPFAGVAISTPLLLEAHANVACKVTQMVPAGNDYILVSGEAVARQHNKGTHQLFYCGKDAAGARRFRSLAPENPVEA